MCVCLRSFVRAGVGYAFVGLHLTFSPRVYACACAFPCVSAIVCECGCMQVPVYACVLVRAMYGGLCAHAYVCSRWNSVQVCVCGGCERVCVCVCVCV